MLENTESSAFELAGTGETQSEEVGWNDFSWESDRIKSSSLV